MQTFSSMPLFCVKCVSFSSFLRVEACFRHDAGRWYFTQERLFVSAAEHLNRHPIELWAAAGASGMHQAILLCDCARHSPDRLK